MEEMDNEKERKEYFVITKLHRSDIKQALWDHDELTSDVEAEVNALTDADMERIASKMRDDYLEQFYWESLYVIYTEMER